MEDPSLYWVVATLALVLSIFFSLAEGALLAYSRAKLEDLLTDTEQLTRVLHWLEHSDSRLLTILTLKNFSQAALVLAIFWIALDTLAMPWAFLVALAAGGLAVVTVAAIPRGLATQNAERNLIRTLPWVVRLELPLTPVLWVLGTIGRAASSLSGGDASQNGEHIVEEIRSAALEGEQEGVLDAKEKTMIESIIAFRNVQADQAMTPRTEMVAVSRSSTIGEALKVAVSKGHSRIPVYEGNLDTIVGILYVKDLLAYWGQTAMDTKTVSEVVREPFFVPENKDLGELLQEFRKGKVHMAIVVDEYGGTAGLISIEDILEEIVGEIEDEYDPEGGVRVKVLSEELVEVDARVHVDDLNQELPLALPEDEDYETLGGFLFSVFGHVPQPGEAHQMNGYEFQVVEADQRRINRVRIKSLSTEAPAPSGG